MSEEMELEETPLAERGRLEENSSEAELVEHYERVFGIDPAELSERVKEWVIGQDAYVDRVTRIFKAMTLRAKRIIEGVDPADLPRIGSAVVIGPTASGKTHLIRTTARELGVEAFFVDCANLTGSGWRGASLSNELARVADWQRENPGKLCIVVYDEADKMLGDGRDDDSFNPQQGLLKVLEGGDYVFTDERDSSTHNVLHADYVLNVFAGAFTGIEKMVRRRLAEQRKREAKGTFGVFAQEELDDEALRDRICIDDLVAWGMKRELMGRVGYVVSIPALSEDAMARIVRGGEHSLEAKALRLLAKGSTLRIDDDAVAHVVGQALASGLGARQLENQLMGVVGDAAGEAGGRVCDAVVSCEDGILYHEVVPVAGMEAEPAVPSRMPDMAELYPTDEDVVRERIKEAFYGKDIKFLCSEQDVGTLWRVLYRRLDEMDLGLRKFEVDDIQTAFEIAACYIGSMFHNLERVYVTDLYDFLRLIEDGGAGTGFGYYLGKMMVCIGRGECPGGSLDLAKRAVFEYQGLSACASWRRPSAARRACELLDWIASNESRAERFIHDLHLYAYSSRRQRERDRIDEAWRDSAYQPTHNS